MPPVRKAARATVAKDKPVDGTRRRRRRPNSPPQVQLILSNSRGVRVHPMVMDAAHEAMRPGQRLVIVDATTVRLVNA